MKGLENLTIHEIYTKGYKEGYTAALEQVRKTSASMLDTLGKEVKVEEQGRVCKFCHKVGKKDGSTNVHKTNTDWHECGHFFTLEGEEEQHGGTWNGN